METERGERWLSGWDIVINPTLNINDATLINWVATGRLRAYVLGRNGYVELNESRRDARYFGEGLNYQYNQQTGEWSWDLRIHSLLFRESDVIATSKEQFPPFSAALTNDAKNPLVSATVQNAPTASPAASAIKPIENRLDLTKIEIERHWGSVWNALWERQKRIDPTADFLTKMRLVDSFLAMNRGVIWCRAELMKE